MKDWTGNYNNVFRALGASNHTDKEREANDYYATHPSAIDALLAKQVLPRKVWEPCCGQGHLSKRLEELGHEVVSSDLVDRGYGGVADFFAQAEMPDGCACIVTNPPYKHLTPFIVRSLELLPEGGTLALFLKTQALEGKDRLQRVYRPTPPKHIYQFSGRVVCAKNGDFKSLEKTGSAVAYCWMVWEKGYKGKTTLEWI